MRGSDNSTNPGGTAGNDPRPRVLGWDFYLLIALKPILANSGGLMEILQELEKIREDGLAALAAAKDAAAS